MKKKLSLLSVLFCVLIMFAVVSCGDKKTSVKDFVAEGSEVFVSYGDDITVEARENKVAFVYTHKTTFLSQDEKQNVKELLDKRFSEDILYDLYMSLKSECPDVSAVIFECRTSDGNVFSYYECPNPDKTYVDIVVESCYNNIINKSVA